MPSLIVKIQKLISKKTSEKIVFVHVPKCGGRSLEAALKNGLNVTEFKNDYVRVDSRVAAKVSEFFYETDFEKGDINDYNVLKFSEEFFAYILFKNKSKFVSGHFVFNDRLFEQFGASYNFITILRDPVKKWFSNYYYRKYRDSDHWKIEENIFNYIRSERGRFHGYDYAKYYGGLRKDNMYTAAETIEKAKENLHKFAVVGILEDVDGFNKKFAERFKIKLSVDKRNVTAKANEYANDPEVIAMIEEICRPDIEIYNYAKKIFIDT